MTGKRDLLKLLAIGACIPALISAVPASAQLGATVPASAQASSLPVLASVATFYDTWRAQPIWFKNGVNPSVVAQLTAILRRAPFEGLASGPQLAAEVQAAAAQAASGKPEDAANAERV